ncbi:MAG TPA: aminotransferase class V-fold PLP-dependent enzyme [Candidatus Dormibacteraeota bacterium]|nr:aminotransferase class V-fold PLP-dependent enzyme [Candidatus Dormibacteraeota bacterium]
MSTASATVRTDWRQEWFEFEDATYLNLAGQSPMPKVSLKAVQAALEAKKFPHHKADETFFEVPARIRAGIAKIIGAKAEEIAVTSGASSGAAAVAHALQWKPGDEVITAKSEFPLQYTTWKPMEEREGLKLKVVAARERFITAEDLIAAMTPRTRVVSVSHVRYNDGSMLDAARVAKACHAQGALLLLDVSQSCGAVPMDVNELGADFLICAGYKWLLGPFGTGFFWVKQEHLAMVRPDPYYWMAVEGSDNFAALNFADPKPAASAKRWDAAEWASYFNFNLVAMDTSVDFAASVGAETVAAHNRKLIDLLFARLPKDRCVIASPLDATHRGPYGCFAARSPEKTAGLYDKLRKENVIVSLRDGNIRVSPYLYNTEQDIDRLIAVVTA